MERALQKKKQQQLPSSSASKARCFLLAWGMTLDMRRCPVASSRVVFNWTLAKVSQEYRKPLVLPFADRLMRKCPLLIKLQLLSRLWPLLFQACSGILFLAQLNRSCSCCLFLLGGRWLIVSHSDPFPRWLWYSCHASLIGFHHRKNQLFQSLCSFFYYKLRSTKSCLQAVSVSYMKVEMMDHAIQVAFSPPERDLWGHFIMLLTLRAL